MGYRINVKNAKYGKVLQNDTKGYSIEEVKPLAGAMTLNVTFLTASGELYGDGALSAKDSKITGATIKFDLNKIRIKDRAAIGGHKYENGIMDVSTDDKPAEIAFYCETEADDGSKEQIWLFSGKAEPLGISGKQSESNISYSTDEITINFVRRKLDNRVLRLADTEESELTEEMSRKLEDDPDAK